ncbi:hypothetical protein COW36_11105 [bacterium (Candidatus Blackallbacteria) CG17_big_fil_post_rev_8_21_14_2_50_48_46]|uniref:Glycosyl transferase family 1 domain-containing protein n=1 Tax=bacterium (Candidatus Blackallbacteria) CG17_big_fil_post_rev_8_21_14_2_50_48_46 TaxID=2014261 RepID=A0A2M7G4I0_9BACT|nr:MAG: hypothetical protein COW64_18200 [bacterium (Candidatus Blackallbacteria) CG18_big_fil_WC_8_21_14_2_50_49_26]PIW16822.1 MAG: hypothetical protein COW36_11105 [bacterium (Candidatus Blackallbacteria) CG17_big_fil_post_rev_8_21_14_2_50_48_46]PIW48019.1 MAG: hypothetical protein COW20_10820 [bacterium (Candidatus Blackallbacteria) CG13_big_fil_rev_8_21_14_2_50_49_14]
MKSERKPYPDEPLYRVLYQLILAESWEHLLYIGQKGDPALLETLFEARSYLNRAQKLSLIESDPEAFKYYQSLAATQENTDFYLGYSQTQAHFPSLESLFAFYRSQKTAWHHYPIDFWAEKAAKEAQEFHLSQQKGQLSRLREFSPAPDFVILDGSEFFSQADLMACSEARLILLMGVSAYKNFANFKRLSEDPRFYLMYQNWQAGFGYALFKKLPALKSGISVVIHTKNEEKNIRTCLESVTWADELLVIDMYSDDTTCEIAREYGAKIIPHIPVTFIDQARNFALAQVQHQWTLVLDADERVPEALKTELRHLSQAADSVAGYWLPRQNWFFGEWIQDLFPDFQMRFFRSGSGAWTGMIHDFARIQGETVYLPARPELALQHYSYHTVQDFAQKQIYYAQHTVSQYQALGDQVQINSETIRKEFSQDLAKLQKRIQDPHLSDLNWLTQTLYFFSNYLTGASLLEKYGELSKNTQKKSILSAYTYLKNGIRFDYPFKESIASALEICDELIICYATDSEDETPAALQELASQEAKIKLFPSEVWKQNKGHEGEVIRLAAEEAMAYCQGEWLWHVQADEVYHETDLKKLKDVLLAADARQTDAYRFKILHFYADYQTLISESAQEIGWYQRCIRLTRRGKTQHIKDAWTQILDPKAPGKIRDLEIRIFHYGHVREHEAMRRKASYMEQLYAPLPEDFEVCPEGRFSYDRVPEAYLETFQGSHPVWMRQRIARSALQHLALLPRKPKVLVISRHHQIKKGFGISLKEIYASGVLHAHFEIHQLAWHYHGPDQLQDEVYVYGLKKEDPFGLQRLKQLLILLEPEVILLHADTHFFPVYLSILENWQGAVMGWFPVDYSRVNNPRPILPLLQRCQKILSLSEFGINQLKRNYKGPLEVVPLGVNTQLFYPLESDQQKWELRKALDWPEEAFVFLMIGNNFWRKGIEYSIESFFQFRLKFPELAKQAFLYLHTEFAESFQELIQAYGLEHHIRMSKGFDPYRQPFSQKDLLKLYQASDTLILTSLGEGFGMPLLEAQACGLPVIGTDFSSIPEVIGQAGLLINASAPICGQSSDCIVWLKLPDTEHAAERMAEMMSNASLRQEFKQKALARAKQMTWTQTAELLGGALSQLVGQGKPVFEYQEPRILSV